MTASIFSTGNYMQMATLPLTVTQAAEAIAESTGQSVNPKHLSNLFYSRALRGDLCPVIAGRRLIPVEYLPQIEAALRRRGLLGDGDQ